MMDDRPLNEPRYPMDRDAATAARIRTLEAENAALRRQLRGNPEPAVAWCEYEPLSVSGGDAVSITHPSACRDRAHNSSVCANACQSQARPGPCGNQTFTSLTS